MSESNSEYLTVSQAAAALGISERQARRYAGRLAPDDRRQAGREAGHMTAALVSLAAMQIEREKATKHAPPDMTPDALQAEAGYDDQPTPDAQSGEVLTLLKSENAFLRSAVEQHQRSEAELRAALRKALEAMPKALPAGAGEDDSTPGGHSTLSTPKKKAESGLQDAKFNEAVSEEGASMKSAQMGRKRKIRPFERVLSRVFGFYPH